MWIQLPRKEKKENIDIILSKKNDETAVSDALCLLLFNLHSCNWGFRNHAICILPEESLIWSIIIAWIKRYVSTMWLLSTGNWLDIGDKYCVSGFGSSILYFFRLIIFYDDFGCLKFIVQ